MYKVLVHRYVSILAGEMHTVITQSNVVELDIYEKLSMCDKQRQRQQRVQSWWRRGKRGQVEKGQERTGIEGQELLFE